MSTHPIGETGGDPDHGFPGDPVGPDDAEIGMSEHRPIGETGSTDELVERAGSRFEHIAGLLRANEDKLSGDTLALLTSLRAELAERPDWPTMNATYEKWKARAEALEQRVAALVGALDPFVRLNARLERDYPGYPDATSVFFELTHGDLRRAAALATEA